MKPRKRTLLSYLFLTAMLAFLGGWAASMILSAFIIFELMTNPNRGLTAQQLLFWLAVTFGCYVAYLATSLVARVTKYPRAPDEVPRIG